MAGTPLQAKTRTIRALRKMRACLDLHRAGWELTEIGAVLGIAGGDARVYLIRAGVDLPRRKPSRARTQFQDRPRQPATDACIEPD